VTGRKGKPFLPSKVPADFHEALGADFKWVNPANMHLTLKFLGDVEPERIAAISAAAGEAIGRFAPFSVRLSGAGAFPSVSRPRVVWVGVGDGAAELGRLAAAVDEALGGIGCERERRRFSAHLTLGRRRSGKNLDELSETLARHRDYAGPAIPVSRVVLFSSVLRPTGPIYTPLSTFELQVGGPN